MKWITLFIILACASLHADEWPQWMGTGRDGIWREEGIRKDLNEKLKTTWRTPVNWGYAGPAVAIGKVYLPDFLITEGEFDGLGQGGTPRTGKELWKHDYKDRS